MTIDWDKIKETVGKEWDASIIPALSEYIEVPNQSPSFDAEWATNGLTEKALQILIDWVKAQPIKGLRYELHEEKGRTPFLLIEIDGTEPSKNTVLMYGHMDKQPPLRPWADGLDPHRAVIRDGKLYGRGGADDGYSVFSAVCSILALQRHGVPHGRVVVIIEACEESGSFDIPFYLEKCEKQIGNVDLMVCLDSGSMNYDQLWLTTSLRGIAAGVLTVSVLKEGIHSGVAGGVVPDSFRIARQLLDRVEDSHTGEVKIPEMHCTIPKDALEGLKVMNDVPFRSQFPLLDGVSTEPGQNYDLAIRNFWKPSLTVTGSNLPEPKIAGNVIRETTALKLSIRLPPFANADAATTALRKTLEENPPYGAHVSFTPETAGSGCSAPSLKPWLLDALHAGSKHAFGKPTAFQGMGGAIPLITDLINKYPAAQFVVTGVLGPNSNAHGPNEFLHIPYAKGVTYCVARIVAEHFHNTPRLK